MMKFRLEWKWQQPDTVFTIRSNNYLTLLKLAREKQRCEWCIRDMRQDVVFAQSKDRKRWNLGDGQ